MIELQILLVAFGTLGILDKVALKDVKYLISFAARIINTLFQSKVLKPLTYFIRYLNGEQLAKVVNNLFKYVFTKVHKIN
jgi:hypothetical protein